MVLKFLAKPVYHILFIIIIGVTGYSNTLNAPFVFDDIPNIVDNPVIKNLHFYVTPSKAEVYKGFAEYPILISRYIGSLTFAINYKINKLDVKGYHIVNILIHLINSLMVYWFVRLIFVILASGTGRDSPLCINNASIVAIFTSLLFVAHPIQTQAVTYIIQRFTSLATMFYLLSIVMYMKARLAFNCYNSSDVNEQKRWRKISIRALVFYLISLLSAVLAMKTKEISFTLPVMIALLEFIFLKANTKSRILYLVPFAMTMLIIPLTLIYIANLDGSVDASTRLATDMSRLDYLFTEFRVIVTYIRLLFFPVGQNFDYDYPTYNSIFDHEVFMSFVALLTMCFVFIYLFYRYKETFPLVRVVFFGMAWFFVTISVESSIIPIADVIFEHRVYLPSLGIFLAISVLSVMIIERFRRKWIEGAVIVSGIVIVVLFLCITYYRNNVWNNELVLLHDVFSKSPGKVRVINGLGAIYHTKGDLDSAIKYYKKSILVAPSYYRAYSNLGSAYFDKGLVDDSIKISIQAIKINQSDDKAYYNLGRAYFDKKLIDESIKSYINAININQSNADYYNNLGVAYFEKKLIDNSIKSYINAININQSNADYYNNLGAAYFAKGFVNDSINAYKNAIKINPSHAQAYDNLGSAYLSKGRIDESIKMYIIATNINPLNAKSYYNLGCAYFDKGLIDDSIKAYINAINIDPSHASAHYNLGGAYMKKGLINEAEIEIRRSALLKNGNSTM